MAEAIHKMTGLSAQSLGLEDRGLLKPGMHADLVLFDPETIADRATMELPKAWSAGIHMVWVNGEVVFTGKVPTRRFAGRMLRHAGRFPNEPDG